MGKIRLLRATAKESELEKQDSRSVQKSDSQAEHVEDVHSLVTKDERTYPILSKRIAGADLPYLPSHEVANRDGKDGRRLWIVVDNVVLDCTSYIRRHPGGQQIIYSFGGQDASWQWWNFHHRKIWDDIAKSLRVGRTDGIENRYARPKANVGLRGFGYQDE